MQVPTFILFLLLHLTDMKLFRQIAVKVSKHLLWVFLLTLPCTDNEVSKQDRNECRERRSFGPPVLALSKMGRKVGSHETIVPRIQMKKAFQEKWGKYTAYAK